MVHFNLERVDRNHELPLVQLNNLRSKRTGQILPCGSGGPPFFSFIEIGKRFEEHIVLVDITGAIYTVCSIRKTHCIDIPLTPAESVISCELCSLSFN